MWTLYTRLSNSGIFNAYTIKLLVFHFLLILISQYSQINRRLIKALEHTHSDLGNHVNNLLWQTFCVGEAVKLNITNLKNHHHRQQQQHFICHCYMLHCGYTFSPKQSRFVLHECRITNTKCNCISKISFLIICFNFNLCLHTILTLLKCH